MLYRRKVADFMQSKNSNPLISGSLTRGIFRLAGPMFISSILQNAQSLIDLFWVGRLGSAAVAALAVSGSILFLLWPLVMGISVGTVALVARHTGAGRGTQAAEAAGQSLVLALVAGTIFGGIGLLSMDGLLHIMGADEAVAALAHDYLFVSFIGYGTIFLLMLAGSALQGAGHAMLPMTAMILANIVNLILDPILIFGWIGFPKMGVSGAALATVIAQIAGAALLVTHMARGKTSLHIKLNHLVIKLRLVWDLFRIGIFSAAQMFARSLMGFALFRIVASCGVSALAGYGIGMRFHQIILLPSFVLGNAAAAMMGQNLGANRPDRSARAAWIATGIGVVINFTAAAIMLIMASHMTRIFDPNPEVVTIGATYLRLVSPFYIFAALGIILGRAMNGAGDTMPTMIITIVTLWGIQVPLAHVLAKTMTPATNGVWWAIAITNLINGLITAAWFQVGRWKNIKIGTESA